MVLAQATIKEEAPPAALDLDIEKEIIDKTFQTKHTTIRYRADQDLDDFIHEVLGEGSLEHEVPAHWLVPFISGL